MFERLEFRLPVVLVSGLLLMLVAACGNGNGNPGNPCGDCDEPPPPMCDGDEVVFFASEGVCEDEECVYPEAGRETCDSPPEIACDGEAIVEYLEGGTCVDGACSYPENREICDDPPEPACDGDVLVSYPELGLCEDLECVYPESRTTCADSEMVCDASEAACVDLCEGVECPTSEPWCEDDRLMAETAYCDWTTGECVYEQVETDLPGCAFAYNFDFEQWRDGEPEGFFRQPTESFRVTEETLQVNSGRRSAMLESTVAEDRNLRPHIPFQHLTEGENYTFHVWYRLEGGPEGESTGSLRPIIEVADSEGVVGSAWHIAGARITEPAAEWREATVTTRAMASDRARLTPLLRIRRGAESAGVWAYTDDWAVTVPRPRNLNARRDLDSTVFLFNDSWWIASGIDNRGVLYPSGRSADADEGWDSIVFSWVGEPDGSVDAPWGKTGRVAGPSRDGALFALLQDVTGHCEWQRYDRDEREWVVVEPAACSNRYGDPTGLQYSLEGTLDLVAHLDGVELPTEVPPWFHFAASHWETGDGGRLVPATQAPASRNSNGHIEADETYRAHRASFLSGRVDSPYVTIIP